MLPVGILTPEISANPRSGALGEPVFGQQAEVADAADAAESLDAVDSQAPGMIVRPFSQVVAAYVRQLGGDRQMVRDPIGDAQRSVQVVVGVVRMDVLARKRCQFSVGAPLGPGVCQAEAHRPVILVQRVGTEDACAATAAEAARAKMVGKRRGGNKGDETEQQTPPARRGNTMSNHGVPQLSARWKRAGMSKGG